MRSGRLIFALLAGASAVVGTVPASAQTGPDIVMRRPLPGGKGVPSTQDDCQLTNSCPTPTPPTGGSSPTPVTPSPGTPVPSTPTTTPTNPTDPSTPDETCPSGHVCSPPTTEPQTTDKVYGWYVHCNKPKLANCESLIERSPGSFAYETVDDSFCARPQSDEANAAVAREGYDRIPGVFYDFTAICASNGGGGDGGGGDMTPIATDPPGCAMDPALVQMTMAPPPFETGIYQWIYGEWSGNGAQCGAQTTDMTRTVGCGMIVPDFLPPGGGEVIGRLDGKGLPGEARVMSASYVQGGAMVDGVYRPGEGAPELRKVQFGEGGGQNVVVIPVSPMYCMNSVGLACNRYTGTKANCEYTSEENPQQTSLWTLPPGFQGTASCSAFAQRTVARTCRDGGGAVVDGAFCENNIRNGGTQDYSYANSVQIGNYSGCTARWVGVGENLGCSADGNYANNGPTHYANYTYRCVRSDGKILDRGVPEAACTGPKPFDGVKAVGTCSKEFEWSYDRTCVNVGNGSGYGYGYEYLMRIGLEHRVSLEKTGLYPDGTEACKAAGATCCAERVNNDDDGPLRGEVSTLGTSNEPEAIYGRYIDSDVAPVIDYGSNMITADGTRIPDMCVQYVLDEDWYDQPAGTVVSYTPLGVRYHTLKEADGSSVVRKCNPSSHYWSLAEGHAYYGRGGGTRYVQDTYYIPNDDPDPSAAPPGSDGGGGGGGPEM